jgi:exopolysaccharide biosynthesis protein
MYVSSYPTTSVSDYRWGVEFLPALIVNGESVVDGTFGMGIQPRAAIGQAKNGDILMLVVDGRQIGYSLGCTVEDCKDIMLRYKGYQAMNLDGGSSAVMWYNGNYITSSSSVTGIGRYMPDAFIVKRAEEDEVVIEASPASSSQK